MPCTTILVGKNASYDGSTIVARNEDSGAGEFTPKKFVVVQPADQPRAYRSVLAHLDIELPDNPLRYTALPNALPDEGIWGAAGVNADNVSMSATETLTSNERVLGADPLVEFKPASGEEGKPGYEPEIAGGIGEEDMLTIVLPYIHTAREGVLRLGGLLERYGTYEMNGIAFSDIDEVWWLETVGGHHWIARRVPDDMYVTMPNQLGIDSFDLSDAFGEKREHMCSPDLREFIEANHLDLGLSGSGVHAGFAMSASTGAATAINPRDAFGSHSDADHVYNTPRAWSMQRFLNPHAEAWDAPDAPHGPASDDIPWCRVPERKVTIEDVKYVLSLHYQGTPYDPYGRSGDPSFHGIYRPIGINRNCQLSVVQLRPYVPAAVQAVQWVAYGSNIYNALIPFYANIDATPEYLAGTSGRVTSEDFYWANRLVAAMADAHYHECCIHVERYSEKVVSKAYEAIIATDREVSESKLAYADASKRLEEANETIADMLKRETDDLLSKVLYDASMEMTSAFTRSDA